MGLRLRLLVFALGVGTGAFAHPCHFTASARLGKPDRAGIRQGSVEKTWRGMTDEYWVEYSIAATFPHLPDTVTPAAAQINRIVRDYVDGELDSTSPCPDEAQLPSRRTNLIAARSTVGVNCEVSYFSRSLLSLSCSSEDNVLESAHASSHQQVITLAIDGSMTRRLQTDDIYLKGAERESLLVRLQSEIQRQDRESDEASSSDTSEDAAALLSDPLFTADGLELNYAPDRWRYYSVLLPYEDLRRALNPSVLKRITENPSIIHRKARPGT